MRQVTIAGAVAVAAVVAAVAVAAVVAAVAVAAVAMPDTTREQ